jgi:hypothetical protein
MLRRLTLAIALITGTAQADDLDFLEGSSVEDCDAVTTEADLEVADNGSITGPIAWSVVRLVLPDVLEVAQDPAWIDIPAVARSGTANSGGANSLTALGGRVVLGRDGTALGVVRRVLVSVAAGRVVALEVEKVAEFDGASSRVVLAWDQLRVDGEALVARDDSDWLRGN